MPCPQLVRRRTRSPPTGGRGSCCRAWRWSEATGRPETAPTSERARWTPSRPSSTSVAERCCGRLSGRKPADDGEPLATGDRGHLVQHLAREGDERARFGLHREPDRVVIAGI